MQRYPTANNSRPPPLDQRRYPPQRPISNWQERPETRQDVNDWRQRPGGPRERGYRREDRSYPRQEFNQFPPRREYPREPPRDYYQRNPMQNGGHRAFQPRPQPRPPPRDYHSNYPPRDFRYPEGPREFRDFYRPAAQRPRPPVRRFDEPQFQSYYPSSHTPSLMSSITAQRRRSPPRFTPPSRSLMPRKDGPPKGSLIPPKIQMQDEDEDIDKDDGKSDSDASSYDQDEVEILIEKVDNDIAKQERILATARAKIAADERNAFEKAEGKENKKKQLLPDSIMQEYRQHHLEHNFDPCSSIDQLITEVYSSNRKLGSIFSKKLRERDVILHNFGQEDLIDISNAQNLDPIPVPRPFKTTFPAPNCNPMLRSKLVSRIRMNLLEMEKDSDVLVGEYLQLQESWHDSVEFLEKKLAKREMKHSDTELSYGSGDRGTMNIQPSSVTTPSATVEDSNQSLSKAARSSRRAGFRSDVIRSEADWVKALSFLGVTESEGNSGIVHKPFENLPIEKLAKEVPMISTLNLSRKMVFKDYNSLVLDPEKDLQDYNNMLDTKWSEYDRVVFKTKLLEEGKDFYKISSYLDQKTTHDCIMYYYREKINLRFKNLLRRNHSGRGRKKKDKVDGDNLRPLFAAFRLMEDEEVVYPSWNDTIFDSSSSLDDDEMVRVPKKSVFDTSAPVSPLGSPTFQDRQNIDWGEEESKKALRGFELFGRDFAAVASMVGTKTQYQCKAFFNNHRRKVREEKEALNSELRKKKKGKPGRKKNDANVVLQMDVDALEQEDGDVSLLVPEKKRKQESDISISKKKKKLVGPDLPEENQNAGGNDENGSRKTVSYWSVLERGEFLKALAIHGKNFEAIAQTLGSKSGIQVRNYFHNSRRKLDLDSVLIQNGHSTDGQIHGPANLISPKEPRVGAEASKYARSAESKSISSNAFLNARVNATSPVALPAHHNTLAYHKQSTPPAIYIPQAHSRPAVDFEAYSNSNYEYGSSLPPAPSPSQYGNRNLSSMRIDSLTTPSSAHNSPTYSPFNSEHVALSSIREIEDAPKLAPIRSDSSSNAAEPPKIPPIRLTMRPSKSLDSSADAMIHPVQYRPAPHPPHVASNTHASPDASSIKNISAGSIANLIGPRSPVFSPTTVAPAPLVDNVVVVVSTKLSKDKIPVPTSPYRAGILSKEGLPSCETRSICDAKTQEPHTLVPETEVEPVANAKSIEETTGLSHAVHVGELISTIPQETSSDPAVLKQTAKIPDETSKIMEEDDSLDLNGPI